jgi:hypothetical protein
MKGIAGMNTMKMTTGGGGGGGGGKCLLYILIIYRYLSICVHEYSICKYVYSFMNVYTCMHICTP